MRKTRVFATLNFLSLLAQVVSAYLIQNKVINTAGIGEVSDKYPSLFTPSDNTFLIWGIIYSGLCILCLYHLFISFTKDQLYETNKDILAMDSFFIFTNLAGIAWMFVWSHEQIMASMILIFVQLVTLIAIHVKLRMYRSLSTITNKIFTQVPLSIYLGWITIATVANVSAYLAHNNWSVEGLSEMNMTIVMIATAVFITVLMVLARKNIFFALPVAWGIYGIITKRQEINAIMYKSIIFYSWIGIGVIIASIIIRIVMNLNERKMTKPFPKSLVAIK